MTALIGGLISLCIFGSLGMGINAFIDVTNKDLKLGKGKDKGKGGVNDEFDSFIEEAGRKHKIHQAK